MNPQFHVHIHGLNLFAQCKNKQNIYVTSWKKNCKVYMQNLHVNEKEQSDRTNRQFEDYE